MKKMKRSLLIVLGCACGLLVKAQPADTANDAIARTLDSYLTDIARQFEFNGTALVAKKGIILLNKGYGWKNAQAKTLNDSNTQYHLGSITKSFTGAAILKLEEEGRLSLSDKLGKYLPEYPIGAGITIENLLRHQSGIFDIKQDTAFYASAQAESTHPISRQQMLALFKDKPLAFKPGAKTGYSNTGYIILGWVIEKVSGKPFERFVREQFFQPLNMQHSGFDFINLHTPDKATGYALLNDSVQRTVQPLDSTAAGAAGGMYSTTGDLYRWSQAIRARALLTRKSWESSYILPSSNVQYGLGWLTAIDNGQHYIIQNGNIKGFSTFYVQGMDNDLVIILLCNRDEVNEQTDMESILMNVWKISLGKPYNAHANSNEVPVSESILKSYTGTYSGYNKEIFISFGDHRLQMAAPKGGLPKSPLFAESNSRFFLRVVNLEIEFIKDGNGNVVKAIVKQDGQSFEFKKTK